MDALAGWGWLLARTARSLLFPSCRSGRIAVTTTRDKMRRFIRSCRRRRPRRVEAGAEAPGHQPELCCSPARSSSPTSAARGDLLPAGRTRGTLLMETRPRDGRFRSFANHLAMVEVQAAGSDQRAGGCHARRSGTDGTDPAPADGYSSACWLTAFVRDLPLADMQRIISDPEAPLGEPKLLQSHPADLSDAGG